MLKLKQHAIGHHLNAYLHTLYSLWGHVCLAVGLVVLKQPNCMFND